MLEFVETVSQRKSLYGYLHPQTVDSLLLESLSCNNCTSYTKIKVQDCAYLESVNPKLIKSWRRIIGVVVFGLRHVCGLNIVQVRDHLSSLISTIILPFVHTDRVRIR